MSVRRLVLVLTAGLLWSAPPASAILIETREGKTAALVGGFLVRDDGTTLTVRTRTADGREQDTAYPRAKVKVIHQLDVKRLEGLSRDDPKGYRDYADELALQKSDPEARDTALRLYLIAAKLAPDKHGAGSLLRMSALAGTPAEARKYRALAYLLDPEGGAELPRADAVKPGPPDKATARALDDFIKALQHYRAGEVAAARDAARKEGVDKVFAMTPETVEQKTFLQWCDDARCGNCNKDGKVKCPNCGGKGAVPSTVMFGQMELCPMCRGKKAITCPECDGKRVREPLPDQPVRSVLRSELWALDRQAGGEGAGRKEANGPKSWSSILREGRPGPVLPLSLETVSEFDPRKCRYRNGKWVED